MATRKQTPEQYNSDHVELTRVAAYALSFLTCAEQCVALKVAKDWAFDCVVVVDKSDHPRKPGKKKR